MSAKSMDSLFPANFVWAGLSLFVDQDMAVSTGSIAATATMFFSMISSWRDIGVSNAVFRESSMYSVNCAPSNSHHVA